MLRNLIESFPCLGQTPFDPSTHFDPLVKVGPTSTPDFLRFPEPSSLGVVGGQRTPCLGVRGQRPRNFFFGAVHFLVRSTYGPVFLYALICTAYLFASYDKILYGPFSLIIVNFSCGVAPWFSRQGFPRKFLHSCLFRLLFCVSVFASGFAVD